MGAESVDVEVASHGQTLQQQQQRVLETQVIISETLNHNRALSIRYSTSTELNHIVHVVLISALDVQSCT